MKTKIISGIMVTMFLMTMVAVAFPARVSASTGDNVVIGIVGPKGMIQWSGIIEGAHMAADLINAVGGMKDKDGIYHQVQLVEIDEPSIPVPDPTAGITNLLSALNGNPNMQFLIGGFSTECVLAMREAAMDYAAEHGRPIWIIGGATDDLIIDAGPDVVNPYGDVRSDYERYKYMFREGSMNSTALGNQLFYMLAQFQIPKLKAIYSIPQTETLPTYIIAEDLTWADAVLATLNQIASLLGINIVGTGRPSSVETDYGPFLDQIEKSGAKLIIQVFTTVAGASFLKQWGEMKVPAVPIGINVESQMDEFYASIGGKCEYSTLLAALGTRSNLNPNAEPLSTVEFWDAYLAKYGHAPIYTAWGGFMGPLLLNMTAAQWIGKSCGEIIPLLEQTDADTLTGHFKYTKYHDLYCDGFAYTPIWPPAGWPTPYASIGTVRAQIPQWQTGSMEVVWPRGKAPAPGSLAPPAIQDPTPLPFARKWKIPPWMYSLAETDFAGGPLIPSPPVAIDTTPAGFFGYFTSPDGSVGPADMTAVTGMWQKTCVWTLLEADMDGNQYIDIDDVARVALDWGKTA